MQFDRDTIAAVATGPGRGAIGIVRVSGPRAVSVLGRVWAGRAEPEAFEERRVYAGQVRGADGGVIDQALAFVMKAPHSYTGEDVVEIQSHGGIRVLEMVLEAAVAAGARLARPGEFTERAFLNGRIDLAQAEAVADLINASTSRAVLQAERQLEGGLSRYVEKLRNELKVMRAQMEAAIDFPEDEDVQGLKADEIDDRVRAIEGQITRLLQTYREGRALREGIRVAIVGKPNVGKSSLLNALLEEERAIVHPLPGTTRDTVEEVVDLGGLPVRFIDTAGIRRGDGEIEREGIRRTLARVEKADLVIVVVDSSRPLDQEDDAVFEAVTCREAICFYNKTDLSPAFPADALTSRPGGKYTRAGSALKGDGIETLKEAIRNQFVSADRGSAEEGFCLTHLRHRLALERSLPFLARVREEALKGTSLEYLVVDLSEAMNRLSEVTGEVTTDEILSEIFGRFCIGK